MNKCECLQALCQVEIVNRLIGHIERMTNTDLRLRADQVGIVGGALMAIEAKKLPDQEEFFAVLNVATYINSCR